MKAKVFIGSSSEAVHIADSVHSNLTKDAECTVWKHAFTPSIPTLSELMRNLRDSDFGIFVLSPDDVSRIRGNEHLVARDNVIFELGMFIGRLGHERTFFLIPDSAPGLRLPTDLAGITSLTYESQRQDNNWMAALNPACQQVKNRIQALKPFQSTDVSANVDSNFLIKKQDKHDESIDASRGVVIEKYKNSYLIKGETTALKASLLSWATWNPHLDAWVLPQSKIQKFMGEFPDFDYKSIE